jgi:hypothetical protein
LDLDHQLCLLELDAQLVALAGERGNLQGVGSRGIGFGATFLGRKSGQIGRLTLAPPSTQR